MRNLWKEFPGCIEICSVPEGRADLAAYQVKLSWLTRYLLPNIIKVDKVKELLAKFKNMKAIDY